MDFVTYVFYNVFRLFTFLSFLSFFLRFFFIFTLAYNIKKIFFSTFIYAYVQTYIFWHDFEACSWRLELKRNLMGVLHSNVGWPPLLYIYLYIERTSYNNGHWQQAKLRNYLICTGIHTFVHTVGDKRH